jgi:hypothetical protein
VLVAEEGAEAVRRALRAASGTALDRTDAAGPGPDWAETRCPPLAPRAEILTLPDEALTLENVLACARALAVAERGQRRAGAEGGEGWSVSIEAGPSTARALYRDADAASSLLSTLVLSVCRTSNASAELLDIPAPFESVEGLAGPGCGMKEILRGRSPESGAEGHEWIFRVLVNERDEEK